MFTRCIPVLLAAISLTAYAAEEESRPDWNETTLTGDWGGNRASLYDQGIDLGFTHKSDVLSNTSGGIRRGTAWLGHTEARVRMNLEKLWGWDAATAYFHLHSQLGSKFNAHYVGSFVGVDNIEAGTNTVQFAHAWLQKSLFGDSLSVLAGIYSIDSEFYVTDTTSLFIQPPYGMSNDVAQPVIGASQAPSIFPIGALALRVKYTTPGRDFYLQGALSDGVPGDPNNPRGTHVKLGNGDGTLLIAEFGYTPQQEEPPFEAAKPGELIEPEQRIHEEHESFNKTAIGFWRYSSRFDDQDPAAVDAFGNPLRHPSQGVYFLAERTLRVEEHHPARGLSGFIRFGTASRDVHQSDWTGSLGLRYHGLLEERGDDIAGISATYNNAGDKYRRLNHSAGNQTNVEATYRAQIKPWLALQPTLQYIINPNMDPLIKDAWIIGARMEVAF